MIALPNALCRLNFPPMHTASLPNQSRHPSALRRAGAWVLVIAALAGAAPAVAVEPLGTLLYSPAQRQSIAAARGRPAGGAAVLAPLKPTTTRLDGVVARGSAKGTAWLNGEPWEQGAPKAPQLRGTEAVVDGRRLRVGESLDTTTGVKTDLVAPFAVRKGGAQ